MVAKLGVITLLSDFGLSDGYVASMKGVILSISPRTRIVDISHLIDRHDIANGAFTLASVVEYFPDGTIHLAVVDPGVGTERRGIVIASRRGYFVGPDNGLLIPAAQETGILQVREVSEDGVGLDKISRTFQGRDVFAPVAAYLATGGDFKKIGPKVEDVVTLQLPKPTVEDKVIIGQIIHQDSFGNLITNIETETLREINVKDIIMVELQEEKWTIRIRPSYGHGEEGEMLATVGGTGFLEISVNQGDASKYTGAGKGEKIRISSI